MTNSWLSILQLFMTCSLLAHDLFPSSWWLVQNSRELAKARMNLVQLSPSLLYSLLSSNTYRHNAEPFSKFAFAMGKYSDWDMAELDITVIRDYAMFMALSSNNQGKNGQGALDSFNKKKENMTWPEYCKDKTWNCFLWLSLFLDKISICSNNSLKHSN